MKQNQFKKNSEFIFSVRYYTVKSSVSIKLYLQCSTQQVEDFQPQVYFKLENAGWYI